MTRTRPVTRFAPSPTGMLHVGGVRTALFSWLYARRMGGKFILRVEDTDRERSTDEAVRVILEGMAWLDLQADEGPYYQTQRFDRYKEVIRGMLDDGTAYHCYCTKQELDEMREQQIARKEKPRYSGICRDRTTAREGIQPVVRFRNPTAGSVVVEDLVHGPVTFQNVELDDLIIARSDGTPTYNFCVVVDDMDMGVTHVIRGDDHLNNTPRQMNMLLALGAKPPVYAHVPMILGPDGAKLSKRHGALGVDAYRAMGYLPIAMRNYLVRLGWAHGDQEIFSTEEMIKAFDLPQIGRSPARFDFARLENLNGHYIRQSSDADLLTALEQVLPHIQGGAELLNKLTPELRVKLVAAMPGLKERAKTLVELVDSARYVFADRPLALDDKAAGLLTAEARSLLGEISDELRQVEPWTVEATEQVVRAFAERRGIKLGGVAQPLRAALTGRTTSPPIFDVLAVLGKHESLSRLQDQASAGPRS